MKMRTDTRGPLLRVHCVSDAAIVECERGPKIECENGHELAQNFPHDRFWDYCCNCDIFSLSSALEGKEAEANCSFCQRSIARRFLCHHCRMMTLESAESNAARMVQLSDDGRPLPYCPGCLEPTTTGLLQHDCYSLFVTYVTAREVCPFCNDAITEFLKTNGQRGAGGDVQYIEKPRFSFPFLESFSQRDFSLLNWKSRLPSSRRGWLELIGIFSLILTALGFALALFPAVPAAISWKIERIFKQPVIVSPIECASHFVLGGERLRFKVRAKDSVNSLQFQWTASAGTLVNHRDQADQSEVELDTKGISSVNVPTEVLIRVTVDDRYGDRASQQERITVMPRRMANNPPVLKIPPRCNCTLQEVIAGENVSLYALAEDENKDDGLTYEWLSSSPSAQILATTSTAGSTVILNTSGVNPKASAVPVKISLRVDDGNGGEVMGDITIMVLPKHFAATRDGISANLPPPNHSPKLEAFGADKTVVQVGESIRLWALVTDPDGDAPLYYDWRVSAGDIQDKNETAILITAGITVSEVIVLLTISDGRGGRTSQKMFLDIKSASASTPSPVTSKISNDQ
jgi:hypothetical protein